jgi:hypothetical protein
MAGLSETISVCIESAGVVRISIGL